MQDLIVRELGCQDYSLVWEKMKHFTDTRSATTADEVWLLEHFPVFTQGQAGKAEHILAAGDISIVQSDRGGQVTYHGPGQLVTYVLLDLNRRQIGTRTLVATLENTVIDLLAEYNIEAHIQCGAPGIYIKGAKIGSIGLRVRKGYSYHGLAFNIDMDLEPFTRINPCGYQGLKVTQLKDHTHTIDWVAIKRKMIQYLKKNLDEMKMCEKV